MPAEGAGVWESVDKVQLVPLLQGQLDLQHRVGEARDLSPVATRGTECVGKV